MSEDGFDFEEARRRFPDHWDKDGWAATNSTWQATNYPQLRVRVAGRVWEDGRPVNEVEAMIYWSGSLDELSGLFTYEPTERWNMQADGLVYGPAGIDREGRWAREGDLLLMVKFDRAMFGGPDTWHINFGENLPFFEPIDGWDH